MSPGCVSAPAPNLTCCRVVWALGHILPKQQERCPRWPRPRWLFQPSVPGEERGLPFVCKAKCLGRLTGSVKVVYLLSGQGKGNCNWTEPVTCEAWCHQNQEGEGGLHMVSGSQYNIPTLQIRKLRFGESRQLAWGHTSRDTAGIRTYVLSVLPRTLPCLLSE